MNAVTWHGRRDVRVRIGPRSEDRGADGRDRAHHVNGDLRLGSPTGGQAEYLPRSAGAVRAGEGARGTADERFLYLGLATDGVAGVEYADVPDGGTVALFGLGPVGQMCARIARHRGARVIAVDLVAERLAMAERHGIETVDSSRTSPTRSASRTWRRTSCR